MKLYSYPKCSTCRDALRFLENNKVAVTVVDISKNPPTKAELKSALSMQGNHLKKLFNTSGIQYKALQLKERLPQMSVDDALELLASNGMLVKRPLLLTGSQALLGFKQDVWQQTLVDE